MGVAAEKPTLRLKRPLVFVVDDDEDFRESLVDALRDYGYAVASAPDGKAALASLRAGIVPGLVLLDLWMPHMDGWQLRQALLEPPHQDVPVIVMTAVGPQNARLLKVQHVLQKPFGIDQLLAAIHEHVQA